MLMESKLQEFEIEMERLCSRMEHLKSQNEVLNLSLEESKTHCDNMSILMGKYESNLIATSLVNGYSDHIINCHDTLLKLLEADQVDTSEAKKLVAKIEAIVRPDSGLAMLSTSSNESPHCWDDSSACSHATE